MTHLASLPGASEGVAPDHGVITARRMESHSDILASLASWYQHTVQYSLHQHGTRYISRVHGTSVHDSSGNFTIHQETTYYISIVHLHGDS